MSKKGSATLDFGHGGYDPGATNGTHREKDYVLRFGLDVNKRVREHGVKTTLTRKDDTFIPLGTRSRIANDSNTDIFVSIHMNSATNNTAKGLETFHYPNSTNGKKLASKIQGELVKEKLYLANRGVKVANFSVLRSTKMPSALVELCFINNNNDIKFFLDNYDKFVESLTKAIVEHLGVKYEPTSTQIAKPSIPKVEMVDDKINLLLISEHVAINGFNKQGTTYIEINDSYISVRNILESLSLEVNWNQELKLITADTRSDFKPSKDAKKVLLLGSQIDVDLFLYKDQNCLKIEGAYIPIRDIFEAMGFKVTWDGKKNLIVIDK